MNKTLFIVLAVCLISVHGFVKRDAPTTEATLESIQKQLKEGLEQIGKSVQDALKPDNIQKQLNEAAQSVNKVIESLKATSEAPKP